jgi:dihydrofolate synthase/folylpolyglutamate synthase
MQRIRSAPLVLVLGMMNTRAPGDFLEPFRGKVTKLYAVDIPGEVNAHSAAAIAEAATASGFAAGVSRNIKAALAAAAEIPNARIVICGSLYLAGHVLHQNGTPPV